MLEYTRFISHACRHVCCIGLTRMQNIMRYHGAKGNLSTSSTTVELEDKFDVLIDANDQLLERVVSKTLFLYILLQD